MMVKPSQLQASCGKDGIENPLSVLIWKEHDGTSFWTLLLWTNMICEDLWIRAGVEIRLANFVIA